MKDNAVSMPEATIFNAAYNQAYAQAGKDAAEALYNQFIYRHRPEGILSYSSQGLEMLYGGKNVGQYLHQLASSLGLPGGVLINDVA